MPENDGTRGPLVHRWLQLLVLFPLALCGAGRATAAEPPTLLVLFDGSGSMWGKLEGWTQSKLAVAREGLRIALNDLPEDARLGLMSFGHRRGGDCNDVEAIVRPAQRTGQQVMDVLEKHNPRGRGPITAALREAARQLEAIAGPVALLLIHDDADNCQLDPCSTLPLLQAAKPDVRVHVVSMTTRAADARHMMCLTQPTQGQHVHVTRASEVVASLQKIVGMLPRETAKVATAASVTAPPPQPKPSRPAGTGLHVTARLGQSGPDVAAPVQWRIFRDGAGDRPVATATAPGQSFKLAAGVYRVEAQLGLARAETRVTVDADTAQTLVLPISAGHIRFTGHPDASNGLRNAIVAVEQMTATGAGSPPIMLRGIGPEMAMPPGDYRLTVTAGGLRVVRLARVSEGLVTALTPPLDFGEIVLNASATRGSAALSDASFAIYRDDPEAAGGRREVAHAAGPDATLTLPAGTYAIVARANGVEARDRVQVRAGERLRQAIPLESGDLTVTVRLPKGLTSSAPIAVQLRRQNVSGTSRMLHRSPASISLPAGLYTVEAQIGAHNATVAQEFRVSAGERNTVALTVPAGQLALRARSGTTRAPLPDVMWEIAEKSGPGRFGVPEAQPLLLLKPGRYVVTVRRQGRAWERDVEVKAGDVTAIDLVVP